MEEKGNIEPLNRGSPIRPMTNELSFPRHIVRMQSRNAPQFQMKAQKERNESFGKSTTECCYKCGRPGHYARNCYKFIKKREQRDFHSAERGEDADQDYNQGNE